MIKKIVYRLINKIFRVLIIYDKIFKTKKYQKVFIWYLKKRGVNFGGKPIFISPDVYLDDYSKVYIGKNSVISFNVTFLTHDYSISRAIESTNEKLVNEVAIVKEVKIGDNVFVGAGSIVLPGSVIENNVIIGAGSVVRGKIKSNSVVIGNPGRRVSSIEEYLNKQYEKNREYFKENV